MDLKLEVVPISVFDVDRAKRFYSEQAGFLVDLDTQIGDGMRLVQLTPPGSGCSIHLSAGILNMVPGVLEGLLLVVSDIEAARAELVERGVKAGQVVHRADGAWAEGRGRALELVRLFQRSGWQWMGPAGASCRRVVACCTDSTIAHRGNANFGELTFHPLR